MRVDVGAAAFVIWALTSALVSAQAPPKPATLSAQRARPREPAAQAPPLPPLTAAAAVPETTPPPQAEAAVAAAAWPAEAAPTAAPPPPSAAVPPAGDTKPEPVSAPPATPTEPTPAAGDAESARPIFEAGRRAYEAGRYAEALAAFQRVFVQTGYPAMLINVANAHIRLNEPRRAAAALQQYLALVPEAPNRAELETQIAQLQDAPLNPNLDAQPPPAHTRDDGLIAGRTFTWVALGTSLVFAGVAGVVWLNANQSFERLALTCGVDGTCSDDQVATVTGGVTATNLCLAASAAALALAVVLYFVEGDAPAESPSRNPSVTANVRADGATLSLTGRL